MFDYYELKFVFHGADCKRRAADMDEARAAKKELQAAGVKEITIFGVKKGTKEIQAAKKAYIKPEFKHEPAPKPAKEPKAKKAPAKKKKAAQAAKKPKDKISKMSADDLRAIDSIFSHDGKIKILKTNTPKREPAGQLDLFKQPKKFKIQFTKDELDILRSACHLIGWLPVENYINRNDFIILQKTLYDAGLFNEHKIELENNEIAALCILIEKKMKGEPNPFINEKLEKLRKQLESFII